MFDDEELPKDYMQITGSIQWNFRKYTVKLREKHKQQNILTNLFWFIFFQRILCKNCYKCCF